MFVPAPARAAEAGKVVGRVMNGTTKQPQKGVEVTLTRLTRKNNKTKEISVTTGPDGRYEFDDLPTGKKYAYAVDAEFQKGLFAGGGLFLDGNTKRPPVVTSTLRVWPTSTNPEVITVPRDALFVNEADGTLSVIESITIFNSSTHAYIGRGRSKKGGDAQTPSLAFALPRKVARNDQGGPEIQLLESDIDLPVLLPSEFGFAATAAIPPGKYRVTYSYRVEGDGASYDLSRSALYPVVTLEVYAGDSLDVRSNRLVSAGDVTVGGIDYQKHGTDQPLDAGDPLQVLVVNEGTTSEGLNKGLIAIGAVVLFLVAGGYLLSRRGRKRPVRGSRDREIQHAEEPDDRRSLLVQIAQLDLDREDGKIHESEWARRRVELRQRVDEMPEDESSRNAGSSDAGSWDAGSSDA